MIKALGTKQMQGKVEFIIYGDIPNNLAPLNLIFHPNKHIPKPKAYVVLNLIIYSMNTYSVYLEYKLVHKGIR